MSTRSPTPPPIARRQVLCALSLGPVALGTAGIGCGHAAHAPADAGSDGTPAEPPAGASAWARGGTRAMTGNYPDPFTAAVSTCVLAPTATAGPCTEAADRVRKDISEGYTGLPMRLALRIVDPSCAPIAGALVKVWHTQIAGSYSGDTPSTICVESAADKAKHYFRGAQTSDADGRVDFDSCFPGWYRGRAIHIHYTVSLGGRSYTSQLLFDQALVNEIFTAHDEYRPFGRPDTTNAADGIVARSELAAVTLDTRRMPDGALLAAKQLVVSVR